MATGGLNGWSERGVTRDGNRGSEWMVEEVGYKWIVKRGIRMDGQRSSKNGWSKSRGLNG